MHIQKKKNLRFFNKITLFIKCQMPNHPTAPQRDWCCPRRESSKCSYSIKFSCSRLRHQLLAMSKDLSRLAPRFSSANPISLPPPSLSLLSFPSHCYLPLFLHLPSRSSPFPPSLSVSLQFSLITHCKTRLIKMSVFMIVKGLPLLIT